MSNIKAKFMINGEEWKESQLNRLEYERNLHILHQLKQHGIEIKNGEQVLSDDGIDYLTAQEAWDVSTKVRGMYSGNEITKYYGDSFKKSDEFWKKLDFGQDKPMKKSECNLSVEGISLQEFMQLMQMMQKDENILLKAHPEHFTTIVTDKNIIGIEPFGMYGTPTLVKVNIADVSELGEQIQRDRDPEYPFATTGKAYLTDGITEINTPFHQLKPTKNGFDAKLAVYWPAGVPDELVSGHSLHLAMEFYEGLKIFSSKAPEDKI